MEDLLELLGIVLSVMFSIIILIISIIFILQIGVNWLAYYKFDNSMCRVYVNNEQVFSGRCHFIEIGSIGENGNTKKLTIYEDIFCFKPKARYVNEKIEVRNY